MLQFEHTQQDLLASAVCLCEGRRNVDLGLYSLMLDIGRVCMSLPKVEVLHAQFTPPHAGVLIWDRASAGSPLKAAAVRRIYEVGMAGTCSVEKGNRSMDLLKSSIASVNDSDEYNLCR